MLSSAPVTDQSELRTVPGPNVCIRTPPTGAVVYSGAIVDHAITTVAA